MGLMDGFQQGYAFADGVRRLNREDKRRAEMDAMAQEDRQRQVAREEKDAAFQDEARGRQKQQWANEDELKRLQAIQMQIGDGEGIFSLSPEDQQFLQEKVGNSPEMQALWGQYQTPESIDQGIADADNILGAFEGTKGRDEAVESANRLLSPWINRGEGGQKRIADVLPSQSGKGFYLELEVTGQDGKPYRAPMTSKRGTAPDEAVKEVSASKLLAGVSALKRALEAKRVSLGDTAPMAARQEAAKDERALSRFKTEKDYEHGLKLKEIEEKKKAEVAVVKSRGRNGVALPAEAALAEWMVAEKVAKDAPAAWKLIRGGSPQQLAVTIAKAMYESRPISAMDEPFEAYLTQAQAAMQRMGQAQAGQPQEGQPSERPSLDDLFKD